jgi:hypothetical protein
MDCTCKRYRHRIFKPELNMSKKIKVTQIRSRIGAKKKSNSLSQWVRIKKNKQYYGP